MTNLIINISAKLGDNIIGINEIYNLGLKNNTILINNNFQTNFFLKKVPEIKKIINFPKYGENFLIFNLIKFSFSIFLLNFKIKNIIYLGEKNKYFYFFKFLFLFKKILFYDFKIKNAYDKNLNLMKYFINSKKRKRYFVPFFKNSKKYITIGFGSETWIYRSFSSKKWISLISLILKRFPDYNIILIGRGKNDKFLSLEIEKSFQNNNIINLVNKTNISTLSQILFYCKFSILIDSGLYHLSNLFEINSIAIFGPDSPKKWFKYSKKNSTPIYHKLNCSPCQQNWINKHWNCPLNSKCLNEKISNSSIINIMGNYLK